MEKSTDKNVVKKKKLVYTKIARKKYHFGIQIHDIKRAS